MVGGGALLSALTPAAAMAKGKGRPPAKFGKGDVGILNFALTLEYLEAAFYNEATANNNEKTFLKDAQAQVFLKPVTIDENAHVAFLKKALGSKAVAAPKVDFGATTSSEASFIKTAVALENTGVAAYAGQALNIVSPAYIAAALSIWSIEARHASVAGLLLKPDPGESDPRTAPSTNRYRGPGAEGGRSDRLPQIDAIAGPAGPSGNRPRRVKSLTQPRLEAHHAQHRTNGDHRSSSSSPSSSSGPNASPSWASRSAKASVSSAARSSASTTDSEDEAPMAVEPATRRRSPRTGAPKARHRRQPARLRTRRCAA